MATKKITDLTELSATPASNDVVAIVDIDADVTKKITISNLQAGVQSFPFTGDAQITGSLNVSGSININDSLSNIIISTVGSASSNNTAVTGNNNIVIGMSAAEDLGASSDNIIIGNKAASGSVFSSTRENNVIIGTEAGVDADMVDGANVVYIGYRAGYETTGHGAIHIGASAGQYADGNGNVSVGQSSMMGHPTYGGTPLYNVVIGYNAGQQLWDGDNNVAIGSYAMANTAQHNNTSTGTVAVGSGAIRNNRKNNYTTAIGFNSLYALKGNDTAAGNYITAVGAYAGYTEEYGYDHTLIGYKAGYNLTASTGSIVIGYDAASGRSYMNKELFIGSGSTALISGSLADGGLLIRGQVSASSYIGDGSGLTGISTGTPTLIASGSVTASTDPATGFVVKASGSTLLDVQGSLGSMFSVSDSFDGNLFEVNNISGISLLNVSSSGDVDIPKGVLTVSGSVSASKFLGDGSALTGVGGDAFPFTGDAQITGSLIVVSSATATVPTTQSLKIDSNGYFYHLGRYVGNSAAFANNQSNTVIGNNITSDGDYYNTIIGESAGVGTTTNQTAIGRGAIANVASSTAIGSTSKAYGVKSTSIGQGAGSTTSKGLNIGYNARGTGAKNIVLNASEGTAGPTKANTFGIYMTGTSPNFEIEATGSSTLSGSSFTIEKSGSTVFEVIGSEGTLFSVDDDLDGTIFTANDASGLPILQADSTGEVYLGKSPQSLYTTKQIASTVSTHTESIYQIDTSSLFTSAVFDYTCVSQSNATAGQIRAIWVPGTDLISFTDTALNGIGSIANLHLSVEFTQSKASFLSKTDSSGWQIKTIIRSI